MTALLILGGIAALYFFIQQGGGGDSANDTGVSVYYSDASITGAQIGQSESSWPGSDAIWNMCAAIAKAEGYDLGPGHVPFDLNNPGDISDFAHTYGSRLHSGSEVTTFPTAEVGWQSLYNKLSNIVGGKSAVYSRELTWTEVAQKWAGNWQAWVTNVTNYLGVDPSSTPAEYASGA